MQLLGLLYPVYLMLTLGLQLVFYFFPKVCDTFDPTFPVSALLKLIV